MVDEKWIENVDHYLKTQNWKNPMETPRRAFDITRDVTLECPSCRVYKTVDRPNDIPANVRLIAIICPDCDDGDFHEETWFSAPGVVVSPDRSPHAGEDAAHYAPELDTDRLRDDRDERRRMEKEFPYAE